MVQNFVKKRSNIFTKNLHFFSQKSACGNATSRKNMFFAYKKSVWQKNPKPKKIGSNFLTYFFDFFDFFPNFVPDLGDQFWYNRLSFWAGLRSKKKTFFWPKFYFPKHFFFDFSIHFPPPEVVKKIFQKISFFSSYPTLFYPPPKNYFFNCVPSISFLNCV